MNILPLFGGMPILGDPERLTAHVFVGTPEQADAFLLNDAGTTRYAPCRRGPALAVAGYLTGADAAAIAAARQQLQQLAGAPPTRAVLPTGLISRDPRWKWDAWQDCWFSPTDLNFDAAGITTGPMGTPQLGYRLLLHASHPLA